jgi:ring-1,2-phenylacetyl-CoA epoxidase subunit PaaD
MALTPTLSREAGEGERRDVRASDPPLPPAGEGRGEGARDRAAADILASAWQILGTIMDPEVPVISIVELGIVRDAALEGRAVRVTITPTYSGCPAMDLIADEIHAAFATSGQDVRIDTVLAPPWTTDWMAPEGKRRLAGFGIAPPGTATTSRIDVRGISPLRSRKGAVACPRCGATATTLVAQFGSTACKALYRCDACREPFDYFKPH